ncbi:ATP-binding cassette domain-containing protein [bacterium]|nr:ATP-binding cassette domain-containing protein [Candidatus Omnitrophota bacterium]MBU2528897.1 ATP-binding cassette domain-containing protein [bacterium]MBU3929992.1 ATP-binding cassette domain-containing protein [bacterium]MBU4122946.1 ATP-binding cassette domain-containing protein [bacterium]
MLKIENLYYKAGDFLLKAVTLKVERGGYFVLLGPTGSGKTTLAKCVCGLRRNSGGKIFLNGADITELPPEKRKIGYLPQDFALFPNMNIRENLLFAPRMQKKDMKDIKGRLDYVVKTLGIDGILERTAVNLSGGEKQRAALGRALLADPEILILDEPFSSIDTGLKTNLWFEMKDFLSALKIPVIHITHNLDEAAVLAGTMGILINGEIVQQGEKEDIFSKPASAEVAQYLGIRNIYSGKIAGLDGERIIIGGANFKIAAFNDKNFIKGENVKFSIRAQDIKIMKETFAVRDELKDNIFEGEIKASHFLSDSCIIKVESALNFELKFPSYIYQRHKLSNGKKVRMGIWQKGINVFRDK